MRLRKKKSLLDQANDYVEAVKPQFESAVATAMDYVENTALPMIADAREKAGPALADAKAKAGPALADAREKAAPVIADARTRAGTSLAEAREKATPVIAAGAALAAEKASTGAGVAAEKAAQGRDLAAAKVAELQGKPEKKKGGKLKKLLLVTGIAAVVGIVARKLQSGGSSDNWQSSYVPTPAPTPPAPPSPSAPMAGADEATDDNAGSSPDEALADQAESPHAVTTPDNPAEVVDLEDPGTDKA